MTTTAGPPRLEQTYAEAVPELSLPWRAAPFPQPRLLVLDEALAEELGLDPDWLRSPEGVAFLVGQVPESTPTHAQAYAGHQFGGYSPRLGDGRALLLGELVDPAGRRRDLHLKGSGRTPFARGGDGKAAVGPMLREHLMGVAMHALGIPTTRALAVVATGEDVLREEVLPGAVLCRVAASHLRVGTFQYAAATTDRDLLTRLTAYALERHHPQASRGDQPALALLAAVTEAQAELVARWLQVGFVHGVMNTDNMTISGQTIDYGPCAFLDGFDPAAVFSSIDTGGRYAFGNQPAVAQWNLARLAEALLTLVDDDTDRAVAAVTEVLETFPDHYERALVGGFSRKLGLPSPDRELVAEALAILQADRVDQTRFFRALGSGGARELVTDTARFDAWAARWEAALPGGRAAVAAQLEQVNPVYVPRNHVVEQALTAATAGDLGPYQRLVDALTSPYAERPGLDDLARPAPADAPRHVTFCGT
ncbi:protein adenylyltransferase SelO [Arsenicicoccus sp. oral taxon 190]|uniref:protein adenylyltransferase SelO n=1 Tax=Arsenicicoccus sp. oral taxon 190 TaxID=1658671 RepID=UPI00067A0F12|nr:YdiU family protein [Arsenicicoccus sp. oral taxon 190]AKT51000.1 hypothetical protein ADJ73_06125 [Arsenicicoccus sp. oral taxon 190]